MDYVLIIQMLSISVGIIISLLIGIWILFHSISSLKKLKEKEKTTATVLGWHKVDSPKDGKVTRIEFFTSNGSKRECDLNSYSIFWKKGKRINIYYDSDRYWEVEHIRSYLFGIFLGLLFLVASIYSVIFLIMG